VLIGKWQAATLQHKLRACRRDLQARDGHHRYYSRQIK
jgi:hypothetical protein